MFSDETGETSARLLTWDVFAFLKGRLGSMPLSRATRSICSNPFYLFPIVSHTSPSSRSRAQSSTERGVLAAPNRFVSDGFWFADHWRDQVLSAARRLGPGYEEVEVTGANDARIRALPRTWQIRRRLPGPAFAEPACDAIIGRASRHKDGFLAHFEFAVRATMDSFIGRAPSWHHDAQYHGAQLV